MTCQACRHWQIKSAQGSGQHDQQMKAMGYRNCLADTSHLAVGRFLFAASPQCEKFVKEVKNG